MEVENPNPVGAVTENGNFTVTFHDRIIGSAAPKPLRIGGHSSAELTVDSVVDNLPADISGMMLREILTSGYHLHLKVYGHVTAKALGFVPVQANAVCDLSVDVSSLASDSGTVRFAKKDCTYAYNV